MDLRMATLLSSWPRRLELHPRQRASPARYPHSFPPTPRGGSFQSPGHAGFVNSDGPSAVMPSGTGDRLPTKSHYGRKRDSAQLGARAGEAAPQPYNCSIVRHAEMPRSDEPAPRSKPRRSRAHAHSPFNEAAAVPASATRDRRPCARKDPLRFGKGPETEKCNLLLISGRWRMATCQLCWRFKPSATRR